MTTTIVATLTSALVGIIVFLYCLRKGYFDRIEEVKYSLFRNRAEGDEEEVARRSYCAPPPSGEKEPLSNKNSSKSKTEMRR